MIHVAQRHGIHYLALPGMLEANLGGEAMQIDATLHAWIVRLPANGAGQALLRHTNNEGQHLQCVKGWRCRCTHVTMTTGTETDGFLKGLDAGLGLWEFGLLRVSVLCNKLLSTMSAGAWRQRVWCSSHRSCSNRFLPNSPEPGPIPLTLPCQALAVLFTQCLVTTCDNF